MQKLIIILRQFHFAPSKFDLVFSTFLQSIFFISRRASLIPMFTRSRHKFQPSPTQQSSFLWHHKATKKAHTTTSELIDV